MIVRILGEGQYDLDDHALDALNGLDNQIESAIDAGDEAMFRTALQGLLSAVRASGTHHDLDTLDGTVGLETMCVAGGMGQAMIVERLS